MGLFGAISKAMQNSKEKTRLEAAKFSEKIEYADLSFACILLVREFDRSSLPVKASITRIIRERIAKEENTDELDRASSDMYDLGNRRHDMVAQNCAQWLGHRLNQLNDYRVEVKEYDNSKTYIPRD